MRLSPSLISLIESHLAAPLARKAVKGELKAVAPALRPAARLSPGVVNNGAGATSHSSLSLRAALRKFPRKPSIPLAVAHRLLSDHAAEPSSSSRVSYLLRRQRIYVRIIRTFTSQPATEWVTIASVFQRMMDEGTPPSLDSLKIVLSTAGRNRMPVLPLLRRVVEIDGLPDKMDEHLLVLVIKGLVREGGMKAKPLRELANELSQGGTMEQGVLDEIVVEAYGQEGDLRGILDILSNHRATRASSINDGQPNKRSLTLSLYLQALKQWSVHPSLRRKRRGSLFPRILAKDMIELYGGTANLPLAWLNAWMNGERMTGDVATAATIWRLIGDSADDVSYSTYFKLAKLMSAEQAALRVTTRSYLTDRGVGDMTVEAVDSALSAAFHHGDLPLGLLLARRLLNSARRGDFKPQATERTVDLIASGIIRSQRNISASGSRSSVMTSPPPEFITQSEWDLVSFQLALPDVALPLSQPQARLSSRREAQDADDGTLVNTYLPPRVDSRSAHLQKVLSKLVILLEEAVVEQHTRGRLGQGKDEVLRDVMSQLHSQVLSRK